MFILLKLEDTVRVPPTELTLLEKDLMACLRSEIHAKYANKIISDQGLVIGVHSILSHNAPQIYPGDGGAYVRVRFRVIVFQPFESEILVGTIKHVSALGLFVSVGFFDWIVISPENMPSPSRWVPEERAWVWEFGDQTFYLEVGEPIRLKVLSTVFLPFNQKSIELASASDPVKHYANVHGYVLTQTEEEAEATASNVASASAAFRAQQDAAAAAPPAVAGPGGAVTAGAIAAVQGKSAAGEGEEGKTSHVPPFQVLATIADQGLGPISWW